MTETIRPAVTYSGSTGIAPQQAVVITTLTSRRSRLWSLGKPFVVQPRFKQDALAVVLNIPIYLRILVKKRTNQTKQRDSAQVTQILLSAHSSFGFYLTLTVQYSGTTVYLQI